MTKNEEKNEEKNREKNKEKCETNIPKENSELHVDKHDEQNRENDDNSKRTIKREMKKDDKSEENKKKKRNENTAREKKGFKQNYIRGKYDINLFPYCISVGNTVTAAGFIRYGFFYIIDPYDGNNYFDSVIAFNKKSENYVIAFDESKEHYSVVSDMMKYIGKEYDEIDKDGLKDKSYKLIKGENGYCEYEVEYNNEIRHFTPTYVLSLLLKRIKEMSIPNIYCNYSELDTNNYPVILTIPADFTDQQRKEMIKAAEEAGLKVEKLISEPIAASFKYIDDKSIDKPNCNILVCDYGESSFKSSIFNLNNRKMKVISSSGDNNNGGKYLTKRLEEYVIKDIKDKLGIDVSENEKQRRKIHKECEENKKLLSMNNNCCIEIGDHDKIVTAATFNGFLCKDLFDKTIKTINRSIDYGKIKDIDYIILIGGSSRVIGFQEIIKKHFPSIHILEHKNPQEVICEGGCWYLDSMKNDKNKYEIIDVLLRSLSIGIKQNENIKLSYGIDLGTTYSSSAFINVENRVNAIQDQSGNSIISSCIYYDNNISKPVVGEGAKQNLANNKFNKKNFLCDSKRFIGKRYNEIQIEDIQSYSFELIEKDDLPYFKILNDDIVLYLSSTNISSEILKYIHNYSKPVITHDDIKEEDMEIVIGVPAAFTLKQREATKESAILAGFKNIDLLSEPTAAALSYIYNNEIEKSDCKMLVYDFGGGTFDVSIIEIKEQTITILGTFGDEHLGGEDITRRLEEYVKDDIKCKTGINVNKNERYKHRIHKACEDAKITLSSSEEFSFDIGLGDNEYKETIARSKFNEICEDLFNKTIATVNYSLDRCNIRENKLDYVILVGGSSRIPKVKELLKNKFEGVKICNSVNTNEDVVKGCAIHSKCIIDKSFSKFRIIDNSSIHSEDGKRNAIEGYKIETIIERESELPIKKKKILQIGKDEKTIRIYEDKLNSSDQMLIGEIEIGNHVNEEIEVEFEANNDGLLIVGIKVDGKIIEKNLDYF